MQFAAVDVHKDYEGMTEEQIVAECKKWNQNFMLWINEPDKYEVPGPHPDDGNDWNKKPWIWFDEDDPNKPKWWKAKP